MARKKLEELLALLEGEVAKAKKAAENTRKSADEIAKSAAHSPSQSGDRTHSQGQADITEAYFKRIIAFEKRIKIALAETPNTIQTPCFVGVKFTDGKESSFYLVEDPIVISGITLVSAVSPLGSALIGKKPGSKFAFRVNSIKQFGEVVSFE